MIPLIKQTNKKDQAERYLIIKDIFEAVIVYDNLKW